MEENSRFITQSETADNAQVCKNGNNIHCIIQCGPSHGPWGVMTEEGGAEPLYPGSKRKTLIVIQLKTMKANLLCDRNMLLVGERIERDSKLFPE